MFADVSGLALHHATDKAPLYCLFSQLNPLMSPSLGFEHGRHRWEASAITTAPPLLPISTPVIDAI